MQIETDWKVCLRVLVRAAVGGPLFMLFVLNSCTVMSQTAEPGLNDRIMAENSQMKKRIPLIERENDVLTQENLQYKSKLRQSSSKIEKLNADLTAWMAKFDSHVAQSAAQLQQWEEKYNALESSSAQQIADLSDRHAELSAQRERELKELNAMLAEQKTDFTQQRDDLGRKAAAKELELSGSISQLQQTLKAREDELASLLTKHAEATLMVDALTRQLAEVQTQRAQIEKELQSARAANAELLQRLQNPAGPMLNSLLK